MAPPDAEPFVPLDTLGNTTRMAFTTTAAGTLLAAVQNALRKQNVGARGILTHSGYVIAMFATSGASYQFVRDASANLRRSNDAYNDFFGGFASGVLLGIPRRSYAAMLGLGSAVGVLLSAFAYTGGLRGPKKDDDTDEVAAKWEEMHRYRSSWEETVEELGEGRGIYGPDYKERRRARLLAKYGVDVGNLPHQQETAN